MNIPPEFADYMVTKPHLGPSEQEKRFTDMHLLEIRERATILCNLKFDKSAAKERIRKYIEWGFESCDIPGFHRSVDSIVDDVYAKS